TVPACAWKSARPSRWRRPPAGSPVRWRRASATGRALGLPVGGHRPGLRLEVGTPQPLAAATSWFASSLAARLGDG
ncbi:hypothetical protein CQA09_29455, partial [Klebsiella pneumoniae]